MERNISESYSQVMVPIEKKSWSNFKTYQSVFVQGKANSSNKIEDHFFNNDETPKIMLEEDALCDAGLNMKELYETLNILNLTKVQEMMG